MNHKIIGFLLLLSGVVLIVLSTLNVYLVFTGKTPAISLFSTGGISLDLKQFLGPGVNPALDLAKSESGSQLELLSADSLNKLFNLSFHLVLMGFISSAGFRLASLGNQLLRTIEVKVNSLESKPEATLR